MDQMIRVEGTITTPHKGSASLEELFRSFRKEFIKIAQSKGASDVNVFYNDTDINGVRFDFSLLSGVSSWAESDRIVNEILSEAAQKTGIRLLMHDEEAKDEEDFQPDGIAYAYD